MNFESIDIMTLEEIQQEYDIFIQNNSDLISDYITGPFYNCGCTKNGVTVGCENYTNFTYYTYYAYCFGIGGSHSWNGTCQSICETVGATYCYGQGGTARKVC